MRPFDRSSQTAPPAMARFNHPATLVCAALALSMVVLAMRIVSIW